MARPKGSKNKISGEEVVDNNENEQKIEQRIEEKEEPDEFISTFSAAERLDTTEPTIKLWIDHGHLRGHGGLVSMRSIKQCRFNTRRMI